MLWFSLYGTVCVKLKYVNSTAEGSEAKLQQQQQKKKCCFNDYRRLDTVPVTMFLRDLVKVICIHDGPQTLSTMGSHNSGRSFSAPFQLHLNKDCYCTAMLLLLFIY